ncbi:SemiSWEET family sugar transporter [Ruegeria atlantica]|jgi:MtN3 and saliva related transmembrane protein|uniref:PQ loop repeat n=1 Tax=Ruegeria atlantica TaxID=81569 RepID=A0A0N7LNY6_9RHOB|nr:PQ-loop domain-containing transporter [Ruegeria atlantica]CUH43724.1 PQ loop repeat [Ruegeria atlantica]CUH47757.1 PQ loop repeat [Ruegeria atlantica]
MEHLIGGAAAVLGTICWLPQTLKTWRSRETKDLSLPANLLILTTLTLWLAYGLMIAAWPLILGNVISILLVGAIVIAKLKFG